jgi:adenylate cyclase
MAVEIERKFLLNNDAWRELADTGTHFMQGYLIGSKQASVRIRIEGDKARLNIKSATLGMRRQEYEYPIPLEDAQALLADLCEQPLIDKVRYVVPFAGHHWEVDVFAGDNAGLVVAEIELQDEAESFARPSWLGAEVTADPRYYNVSLVKHPFKDWT